MVVRPTPTSSIYHSGIVPCPGIAMADGLSPGQMAYQTKSSETSVLPKQQQDTPSQ